MPIVEGAGVELAYEDSGTGPPITLVIHGMASGARAAASLQDALPGRVIAYDRRGYGGSGAPEPYAATTV
jgi:pimeloyl-ACP methyl ester carboxylesterase